jgi:uncharacterized membrane protein YccC
MTGTVAEIKTRLPFLGQALEEVVLSLQSTLVTSGTLGDTQGREPMPKFIRHREWRQAGRAAIRAALAIGAVGITWAVSGWTQGPMMIMAMSIMLSIFSSKDHPAAFVGQIFIGAGIGSATAVICRLVLLPEIHDPFLAGVMLAPFILLGTFAMTQRRFAIAATDATLFFIFVAQPGVSVAIVPQDLVLAAIAMVMGVGSAWLAYRFLVPINPIIRMRSHLAAITRDIEALAAANDPSKQERLQARMQHRVIRLVSLASRYDPDHLRLIQGGLAALAIGRALRETHKHVNLLPAATRLINDNFGPLSTSARHTHEFLRALETVLIALHRLLVPGLENDCCTQPVATAYVGTANLLDLKQNSGPCPS